MWLVRRSAKPERNLVTGSLVKRRRRVDWSTVQKECIQLDLGLYWCQHANLVTVMAAISICLLRARTLPERGVEKEGLLFIDVLEF